ncbi:MAG: hypothetical protein QM490_02895 [Candidatus Gracilibacteria bacterium]
MRKIITYIIAFIIFFSSLSITFAEEGYIEKLLDLNFGVEEYNLNLSSIDYIHFNNPQYNHIYNELKTIDSILREEFMKKYRSGEYEYYQTNGIITNYNNFVYYINRFFFYLKIKEGNSFIELDTAIIRNYRNMRSSYTKVKNIVKGY